MSKRVLLIILPTTVLAFSGLAVWSYLSEVWPLEISVYFAVMSVVAGYTARQSVFIQSSLVWEVEDLNKQELNDLASSIVRDYTIFLIVHGAIVSALYFVLYWLSTVIGST